MVCLRDLFFAGGLFLGGGGLFTLQVGDAAAAFLDFTVLLSHNSFLCLRF